MALSGEKIPLNLWEPFVQQELPRKITLAENGILDIISNSPLAKGGHYFIQPVQQDMSEVGDSILLEKDTALASVYVDDIQRVVVVCNSYQVVKNFEWDNIKSGFQRLQAVASQVSEYWARQYQRFVIAAMKGCATALTATHDYDATGLTTKTISVDNLLFTSEKAEENADKLTTIIVNSAIFNDLALQMLIQYGTLESVAGQVIKTGVPMFMGKKILVNDTLCVAVGNKYPCYFMGDKVAQLYWQKPLEIVPYRSEKVGFGLDELIQRTAFAPHVKGMSWTAYATITNPTIAQLATSTNWTAKDHDNSILMYRLYVEKGARS